MSCYKYVVIRHLEVAGTASQEDNRLFINSNTQT